MFGCGGLDERASGFRVDVERDGDDFEAAGMELGAQCLPPGQVEAAASPRGPGNQ